MVKRAFLEIGFGFNGLTISGDTPNGRDNYFDIPVELAYGNIDFIFPCYYDGKIYIFYPSSYGDAGYSIYDGSSFSDYISIPESGNKKLLGAVSVRDGLVVFTKNVKENNLCQMIKFKNGEWLDFESINNLKIDDNEQFCGVSVNGDARVLRAAQNLQFISSSDNFQYPFNIIWDGSYIGVGNRYGYSISAELSSFDFIFCTPEHNGVAVYLQDDKTHVRRLGYIEVPQLPVIHGTSIYRISVDRFKIYIIGSSGSSRKAYSGEFNINNVGSGISEVMADYSIRKYISAWVITN